jgi:hypothetical protein
MFGQFGKDLPMTELSIGLLFWRAAAAPFLGRSGPIFRSPGAKSRFVR